MSFKHGMAALNLEFTDRVPRTEYSAAVHWPLVNAVTGSNVSAFSPEEDRKKASEAFKKAWNYDFDWNVLVLENYLQGRKTTMGHAVYAEKGVDFIDNRREAFSDPEEVLAIDMFEEYGTLDIKKMTAEFDAHYDRSCANSPDLVNMTGIYITLVSGLIEMLGWDMLLLTAGVDPKGFGALADRYAKWIGRHFEALANSKAPVVMVHDDIVWSEGPFIHPDWYREFIFPNYKKMFAPLHEAGKKIIFTSDGTYTKFIDDIADCGVSGFVLEPTTDMAYIAEKYGKTHSFIGNADTRILLRGSKEDICNEVKRCMDIGKKYPGFFMAVGNHIPANTPVENALYYNECYEKLSKR